MIAVLKRYDRAIYIAILALLAILLTLSLFPSLGAVSGIVTPPVALFVGLLYSLLFGRPYAEFNSKMSKKLLQYSVVGLGFGMNLYESLASGGSGMLFTIVSVFGTLAAGWFIGRRVLGVERNISYLISSGTAICGGSAIAAVGPVIKAKGNEMSVALGCVFILNAVALFLFPAIGEMIGLSQQQFGMWAAIAIHDTSSVVGAGAAYGEEALQVATTIKLTRALWIVPVALFTSFLFKSKGKKVTVPTFIILFVAAMVANTYLLSRFEAGVFIGDTINLVARKALTLTMFFIGASLSVDLLKGVGFKPLLQGVLLWVVISVASLAYICLLG